jgi:hypothetical protein
MVVGISSHSHHRVLSARPPAPSSSIAAPCMCACPYLMHTGAIDSVRDDFITRNAMSVLVSEVGGGCPTPYPPLSRRPPSPPPLLDPPPPHPTVKIIHASRGCAWGADGSSEVGCAASSADLRIFVYQLNEEGPSEESTGEAEEDVTACNQWVLPSKEFHNLWERCVACHCLWWSVAMKTVCAVSLCPVGLWWPGDVLLSPLPLFVIACCIPPLPSTQPGL